MRDPSLVNSQTADLTFLHKFGYVASKYHWSVAVSQMSSGIFWNLTAFPSSSLCCTPGQGYEAIDTGGHVRTSLQLVGLGNEHLHFGRRMRLFKTTLRRSVNDNTVSLILYLVDYLKHVFMYLPIDYHTNMSLTHVQRVMYLAKR